MLIFLDDFSKMVGVMNVSFDWTMLLEWRGLVGREMDCILVLEKLRRAETVTVRIKAVNEDEAML